MNQDKQELFVAALQPAKNYNEVKENNEGGFICSNMLIAIIHKALKVWKRSRPVKKVSNTFMVNPWYDEESKAAKRTFKENKLNKDNKESRKNYKQLLKSKKKVMWFQEEKS